MFLRWKIRFSQSEGGLATGLKSLDVDCENIDRLAFWRLRRTKDGKR